MSNKALRLPIILVALMAMAGIINWLRPHTKVEAPTRSSTLEVEAFDSNEAASANTNITINGLSQAEYAAQNSEQNLQQPIALKKPNQWTSADITLVKSQGSKTILVFRDGSSREVTAALYNQLPGSLQTQVGYSRDQ
jgi:hypothetical protein